ITAEVLKGLQSPTSHRKSLPSMLLYDELGLRLYEEAAHIPEYYPFSAEEEILREKSDEIVAAMHPDLQLAANEVVLELGAGPLCKTSHILLALSRFVKGNYAGASHVTYYALDLEERELDRTLTEISLSEVGKCLRGKVNIRGLCATYDQGLKFAASGALHARNTAKRYFKASDPPFNTQNPVDSCTSDSSDVTPSPPSVPDRIFPPLHILFFGTTLGNFASRTAGADFLRSLPLRPGSGDRLLIGLDRDNEKTLIEEAYNDRQGYIKRFMMNGLKGAGRALGDENLFNAENWEYGNASRHEAFLKAKRHHTVVVPSTKETINFLQGEEFSDTDAYTLFSESNLRPIQRWTDSMSRYSLWLLDR
ncbi:histidine-specific methyltransferase, partial [Mycena haematopus]